jgi:hypothetical protein
MWQCKETVHSHIMTCLLSTAERKIFLRALFNKKYCEILVCVEIKFKVFLTLTLARSGQLHSLDLRLQKTLTPRYAIDLCTMFAQCIIYKPVISKRLLCCTWKYYSNVTWIGMQIRLFWLLMERFFLVSKAFPEWCWSYIQDDQYIASCPVNISSLT